MHEELAVALDYRSMGRPMRTEGGKGEFCEYTKEPVPALKAVLSSMNVTRENIEVKRDRIWLASLCSSIGTSVRLGCRGSCKAVVLRCVLKRKWAAAVGIRRELSPTRCEG